jgi:hypothetical protein
MKFGIISHLPAVATLKPAPVAIHEDGSDVS